MKTDEKVNFSHENSVQYWFAESIYVIKCVFGVENLSINELFIMRKIVVDVLTRSKDRLTTDWCFEIDKEVVTRFLIEAYGIDPYYITKYESSDDDCEQFREYIRRIRDRAHLI